MRALKLTCGPPPGAQQCVHDFCVVRTSQGTEPEAMDRRRTGHWGIAFFEYMLQVPGKRFGHTVLPVAQLKNAARGDHTHGVRAVCTVRFAGAVEAGPSVGTMHHGAPFTSSFAVGGLPVESIAPADTSGLRLPPSACLKRLSRRGWIRVFHERRMMTMRMRVSAAMLWLVACACDRNCF